MRILVSSLLALALSACSGTDKPAHAPTSPVSSQPTQDPDNLGGELDDTATEGDSSGEDSADTGGTEDEPCPDLPECGGE